ncbi:serine hydrolase [Actinoallomurus rhizosphaericola]|uniref:serine hydrolase n=1 Tax=Actinoallomurus rhizosphaericola TaxID=2952536 RepID=UPI0020935188|nr:serine hydrolase [Actinoallomurus rhizosphaericola]MCO5997806.1 serine hydrolase [Actinoallomurus rhizosphaericola]
MRRALPIFLALAGLCAPAAVAQAAPPPAAPVKGASAPARTTTDGPPTVTAADLRFTPGRVLRDGTPQQAGLSPDAVAAIGKDAASYMNPSPTMPYYPGAVVLAARNGVVAAQDAMGYALRYSDDKPTELPRDQWIPMRNDTIFDLASMSKLFTTVAAIQQIQRGRIDLNQTVAHYLPAFGQNGKDTITIRELLTHTSGLRPDLPFYNYPDRASQEAALFADTPQATPGTAYIYSDLNMITMQFVLEKVTGKTLDVLVRDGITRPLGMRDTGYNPPASEKPRIAATEYEHKPYAALDRGLVWGQVHDENSYALGGVAGHAGVFSTAHDIAIFAQMILDGGRYGHARVLDEDSVRLLFTDFNTAFPGNAHGLGFEIGLRWYEDAMTSPVTIGHTGYTGTSIVIDPISRSFVILLTNRVHPTRNGPSINPARRAVARDLGRAVPVRPAEGRDAWFSQMADGKTATLTAPMPAGATKLSFDLWYDTEETDLGVLETTTDGTTWTPAPLSLRSGRNSWTVNGSFSGFSGRRWAKATATLPAGTTAVRWRYTSDPAYQGRGVYVDGVRAWNADGHVVFNGERPADAARFQPAGWVLSSN